eukprot:gene9368-3200_t
MVLPLEQVDPRGRRGVTHNRKGQQLAACDDCVRIAGAFSAASSSPADPCGGALFNRDCGCQLCGGRVMLLGQQHEHISWCTCLEQDEAEPGTMKYNFNKIETVPKASDFIDVILSKTQRKTPTVVHPGYAIVRIRQFYMRKVKFTHMNFHEKLTQILTDFPRLDDIHPFYADLLLRGGRLATGGALAARRGAIESPRRAAIVCTMAYNSSSLDSFICYYLFLGFSTLYLYLDDAADATFQIARRYPADRVRVRLRDASLRIEWERMPSWTRLVLCADTEVQARQLLNCEHAIARIRAQAAPRDEWLLHIDSDELLFLPAAAADLAAARVSDALQGHLAYLEKLGAILFTYRNLEGVPEALTCDDALRSISLFKEHPSRLDERVPAVARAVRYWTSASNAGGELFRFYTNGKSIVRVQDAVTTAVSVHEWSLPSKQ